MTDPGGHNITRPYDPSDLLGSVLTGKPSWRLRLAFWLSGMAITAVLTFLRVTTDAEFAFMSFVILPVLLIAWFGKRWEGIAFSAVASTLWAGADLLAGRQFSMAWVPLVNGLTRFAVFALIAYLTAMLRIVLLRQRDEARRDALTGLLNRRAFHEVGIDESERAKRHNYPLAIAFLDLDNFKQLNDIKGHKAGDRALKAVALTMSKSLRTTDRIARLGGDEFAVILPEVGFEAACDSGRRLANAINNAMRMFPPVSVSVGIAWFEHQERTFAQMLDAADGLMYEVKNAGKQDMRCERFDGRIEVRPLPAP